MISILLLLFSCSGNPEAGTDPVPGTAAVPAPQANPVGPPLPAPQLSTGTPATPNRATHANITRELGTRPMSLMVRAPTTATPASGAPGPKTTFGLYLLALTWEPQFCCDQPKKGQCEGMSASFGGDHLTLHGLWPNYTDAESTQTGEEYPTFCGDYASCATSNVAACDPDHSTIPGEMSTYGPGYVTDSYFLADHEWPKHGSCTGLDSKTYFQAAIDALKGLPGDQGTPDLMRQNIGGSVSRTDLAAAFGQADAVMFSCTADCTLKQVEVCLGLDQNNVPTGLTTCPDTARKAPYTNSCELNKCDQIKILKAGACPSGGSGGSSGSGEACSTDRGQGPACTGDATCTAAGYARCANSGCCTSVPVH